MNQETQNLLRKVRDILSFHEEMGLSELPWSPELEKFLNYSPDPTPYKNKPPLSDLASAKREGSQAALYTPLPPSTRDQPLSEIYEDIEICAGCALHESRKRVVKGCGPAGAKLFIIEDPPTAAEEEEGLPFSGEAGDLFDKMLKAIDLDRSQVYLTTLVKCRPSEDRAPTPEEIRTCLNFLAREIAAVTPLIICTMGPLAAKILTGVNQPLYRFRGKIHDFHGTPLIPSFHPRFLIKNPDMKKASWADLQLIRKKID